MSTDPRALGQKIIEYTRKARLGDTPMEEWRDRILRVLRAQPDFEHPIEVRDVHAMKGGAGASSGTLFFEAKFGQSGFREYVLRFTPAEQLFHVYDLDGQVRIQRALATAGVPVPIQVCEDISGAHLGVSGYIMERAKGQAAPAAWFAEGVIADATPEHRGALIVSFFATMARIHAVDWRGKGLSFLLERARGQGLIGREIEWYWDALAWAGETAALARYQSIRAWLLANQPPFSRAVLCHGDANFTNVLFEGAGVSAVLDWEMAFIGTPECDVAYALVGMSALSSTFPEGVPDDDALIAAYEAHAGVKLAHMDYYVLFARYRMVLIHILGLRAFPPEFQAAFKDYLDGLIARLDAQARAVGAV